MVREDRRRLPSGACLSPMNPALPDPVAWSRLLDALSRAAGQGPESDAGPPPSLLRPARTGVAPEGRLWASALAGGVPEDGLVDLGADGPLWDSVRWAAIEVWTESELCGLHALGRLRRAVPAIAPAVSRRLRSAIRWHLEHTQPDNATHRPWAVHLFLSHPDPEVDLYGQTLLHNFEAAGRGDRDAAWILADAAREIRIDPGVATRW